MSLKSLIEKMSQLSETAAATDFNPSSQGGTRKELLAKYAKSGDAKDAEAARKAGATQDELKSAKDSKEGVAEGLKGDMHPDADKVLKHIDPKFHGVYKPYLKAGVYKGDYQDRADVLSAAERAGHINKQGLAEGTESFTYRDEGRSIGVYRQSNGQSKQVGSIVKPKQTDPNFMAFVYDNYGSIVGAKRQSFEKFKEARKYIEGVWAERDRTAAAAAKSSFYSPTGRDGGQDMTEGADVPPLTPYASEKDFFAQIPKKYRDATDSPDGKTATFYDYYDPKKMVGQFVRDDYRVHMGPGKGWYNGPTATAESIAAKPSNLREWMQRVENQYVAEAPPGTAIMPMIGADGKSQQVAITIKDPSMNAQVKNAETAKLQALGAAGKLVIQEPKGATTAQTQQPTTSTGAVAGMTGATAVNEDGLEEVAPEGWEGTVKAMKKHDEVDNPWALAHWMKGKGYESHKPVGESKVSLDSILSNYPHEHKMAQEGWGLEEGFFNALCDHYHRNGAVPRNIWHGPISALRGHIEECYMNDTVNDPSEHAKIVHGGSHDMDEGIGSDVGSTIGGAIGSRLGTPGMAAGSVIGGMIGDKIETNVQPMITGEEELDEVDQGRRGFLRGAAGIAAGAGVAGATGAGLIKGAELGNEKLNQAIQRGGDTRGVEVKDVELPSDDYNVVSKGDDMSPMEKSLRATTSKMKEELTMESKKKSVTEGEVTKVKGGIKHRGHYGTSYDGDDEEKATAPAPEKRGRGRPRKDSGEAATSAKYGNAKALQDFMVGNLPKGKLPGKPGTKHKLKDDIQMESWENQLRSLLESDDPMAKFDEGEPEVPVLAMPRGMGMSHNPEEDEADKQITIVAVGSDEVLDHLDGEDNEPMSPDDGGSTLDFIKRMMGARVGEKIGDVAKEEKAHGHEGHKHSEKVAESAMCEACECDPCECDDEKLDEGNDGNLANNAKPYDKVTQGDVVAGRLGKDEMGGKKGKSEKVEEGEGETCNECGAMMEDDHKCSTEKLDEWANTSQGKSHDQFITDIDFMTKVISGGLNNMKQDQTTLPSTRVRTQSEQFSPATSLAELMRKLGDIK